MPTLMGFGTFAGLPEEQVSENISRRILSGDQGMLVWWSIGTGVDMDCARRMQMSKSCGCWRAKWEFRLGSERRVCGPGDLSDHSGRHGTRTWFRENTEVIDFFAPPRDDFLLGREPAYIREGCELSLVAQTRFGRSEVNA